MSIESVMPSNHLILCSLLLLPSIFPSVRVFSNESALRIRWPKYWSFNFSISPSNEHSGLISCRIDLFDLLTVQGTVKSLLQHHKLKVSVLWCLAFFMVKVSHLYMTTGKTIFNNQFKKSNHFGSTGKESACNAEDLSSIPGSGKCPGEGNDYLCQCFGLENPMYRGAWYHSKHASHHH